MTAKLQVTAAKDLRETATQNVQCSKKITYICFLVGINFCFTKHNCGPDMTDIFLSYMGLVRDLVVCDMCVRCVTCVCVRMSKCCEFNQSRTFDRSNYEFRNGYHLFLLLWHFSLLM